MEAEGSIKLVDCITHWQLIRAQLPPSGLNHRYNKRGSPASTWRQKREAEGIIKHISCKTLVILIADEVLGFRV